jgi:hypothetical protein
MQDFLPNLCTAIQLEYLVADKRIEAPGRRRVILG